MSQAAVDGAQSDREDLDRTIRHLAAIPDRGPCSAGEREAAHWIAGELNARGAPARVEEERAYNSYARPIRALGAAGLAAGVAALATRRRTLPALAAAAAAAGVADEVSNGPWVTRRLLFKQNPAWNVVAESGDPAAERALVFLAHHDAAPTGMLFQPGPLTELASRHPRLHGWLQAEAPLWWPATAAPAIVALGAATGRRGLIATGTALCALLTANMADIGRDRIVPGANDNLTAVAVLLVLARAFAERPLRGLRVLLVSCGAEESFQGGVRAFAARHFPSLPPERTRFVVLETLGSPELKLCEAEGPLKMEPFPGPEFRDLVERVAGEHGIRIDRGKRFRFSSDSVIPARAGYPLAMLASQTPFPEPWTYHQMADTPENIDLDAVVRAARLSEAVARELAA